MLNIIQLPRNYQGLINDLPIHFRHEEADLYREVQQGDAILFKPVDEFITLKNNDFDEAHTQHDNKDIGDAQDMT